MGPHALEKRWMAREMRRNATPAEACLWQRLRRSQLGGLHFRRQQVIDGFIVDFYCHAAGIVVEVDGPVHEARQEYDADRARAFARRGLRELRFPNERVFGDVEAVLEEIQAAAVPPQAER
ncbi:MAG: endonuclease domain-containing protein [Armatimonadetes bacterium]|nr:endonuclease domain-containing protein [Armatimonadota bacterium]